jgi:hypothetical protein
MHPNGPIACTLSPSDYRARLAEIAELSRATLRHVERRGLTTVLSYGPEAAALVRDLVEKERRCCAFLQLELEENADAVRLVVTVPPEAAEAVPELLAELTGRHP